ncbi:MAG: Nif3-like dinuclear metal center hexameric protein [Eggerthellaceae bacterium]|nr:Nif3-like dinuclear metal center hexameric protein [Eggerthellaceae bacterium]
MALFGKKQEVEEEAAGPLSKRQTSELAKTHPSLTIGALEEKLLKTFPAAWAEDWDRTGLLVGERGLPVEKVAIALDPTVGAIRESAAMGANVLLTHHPAYLTAPDAFAPEASVAQCPGAGVWEAIRSRVALMDFHTALDVSPQASRMLPNMLNLAFTGKFAEPSPEGKKLGYGQICEVHPEDKDMDLAHFAARVTAVFKRQPRVWGAPDAKVTRVVTATGSLGPVGRKALELGCDCVVCGEIRYHEALDLSQAGMSIIELGHDTSELPLTAILAEACLKAGVPDDRIVVLNQSDNWWLPETIRL